MKQRKEGRAKPKKEEEEEMVLRMVPTSPMKRVPTTREGLVAFVGGFTPVYEKAPKKKSPIVPVPAASSGMPSSPPKSPRKQRTRQPRTSSRKQVPSQDSPK